MWGAWQNLKPGWLEILGSFSDSVGELPSFWAAQACGDPEKDVETILALISRLSPAVIHSSLLWP